MLPIRPGELSWRCAGELYLLAAPVNCCYKGLLLQGTAVTRDCCYKGLLLWTGTQDCKFSTAGNSVLE